MADGTVKNGTRVPVEFGPYSGQAAIEGNRVIFPGQASDFRQVVNGTVDGQPVKVVARGRNAMVPKLVEIVIELPPPLPAGSDAGDPSQ